jgi:hypothetical protein
VYFADVSKENIAFIFKAEIKPSNQTEIDGTQSDLVPLQA